jgi:anti-sigma factor RsiW
MTCDETRPLLGAHVDHELDLRTDLEVQAHLRGCPACRSEVASLQALHEAAQAHLTRHAMPEAVAARLRRAVQPPARRRVRAPWIGAAVAALAAGIIAVVAINPGADRTERDVVAAHARSLLGEHAIDVASSDSHTVKPWFHGKVSFGVPAASFADQGFPLLGGRLDYVDGHEVAALVYQRRKHLINLFVWPSTVTAPPHEAHEQGYAIMHWADGGLAYWLVTDAQAEDLRELQRLIAAEK